jgi:hypothetical protein
MGELLSKKRDASVARNPRPFFLSVENEVSNIPDFEWD